MTKIPAMEGAAPFCQIIRGLVEDQWKFLFCPKHPLKKEEENSVFVRTKVQIAITKTQISEI